MEKKQKRRKEKGITLVALVVTIIVLIILAGVTLNIVLDQNRIISKTNYASRETEKEALTEEIYLAISSTKMDDELGEDSSLKEELEKIQNAIVTDLELKVGEDYQTEAYYVERNENGYTVYRDGSIIEEGKTEFWDGTITQPRTDEAGNWHIDTTAQMKYFAEYCTNFTEEEKTASGMPAIESTTTVYLENNLDMGARHEDGELKIGEEWTPIKNFSGIFDGNNHSIRGIYVNTDADFGGIFERVSNMTKNLIVKDSYIIGQNCVGGIAGMAKNVENCHNINTTVRWSGTESQIPIAGGIVGFLSNGEVKDCTNSGLIYGCFTRRYSTVLAYLEQRKYQTAIIQGVYKGQIELEELFGNGYIEITRCTNSGTVVSTGSMVGGISGYRRYCPKLCKYWLYFRSK